MNKNGQRKSAERGISSEKALRCLREQLGQLLDDEELFLGIRNGYCNLYYRCDSIGKIRYMTKRKELTIKISQKYLPDKPVYREKRINSKGKEEPKPVVFRTGTQNPDLSVETFCILAKQGGVIRSRINCIREASNGGDNKPEKTAQQRLVRDNNANPNAEWFCVDLEYVQERQNSNEHNFGRFDIVAIKKLPDSTGKHPVAIIELKVGTGAYGGAKNVCELEDQRIDSYSESLGSGLLGHFADFYRFQHHPETGADCLKQLKRGLRKILENKAQLGLFVPDELRKVTENDLACSPEFYFLTLHTEEHGLYQCQKSFKKYINDCPFDGENQAKHNVTKVFAGSLMKEKPSVFNNYHFYFSRDAWEDDTVIPDILSLKYFEEMDHSELFLPR